MEFVNHTVFPCQDFAGIDQHDQEFYVVALRQTLEWGDDGLLRYAAIQDPLCESDIYWGIPHASGVRQESDYCQYKPMCDVIVNATAYAPRGVAAPSFSARLQVRKPDTEPVLPDRPQGLNQFMRPSPEALRKWRDSLPVGPVHGEILIDKELRVYGAREFRRKSAPGRCWAAIVKLATFGTLRLAKWTLSRPAPAVSVALRPEFAFGGECRIDANERAAARVPAAHRLTEAQASAQAALDHELGRTTIASTSFEANPLGRGYAQRWYLKATRYSKLPAPQLECSTAPVTALDFEACLDGKNDDLSARLSTGLGARPKSHPQRRRLAGTVDDAFAASDRALPDDFDFAIWNAAAPDQQTGFLQGGEVIELTNLCPASTPGSTCSVDGHTILTLTLPPSECYLLIRLDSGEMFASSMAIDSVIVEPDSRRLSLVWRKILARTDEVPVRAAEAMTRTHEERDTQRERIDAYKTRAAMWESHTATMDDSGDDHG